MIVLLGRRWPSIRFVPGWTEAPGPRSVPERAGRVADAAALDLAVAWRGLLRVPLFSVVTVGLGVCGHVLGGGNPPDAATLALLVSLVGLSWREA